MGCSNSRLPLPNNPMQLEQYREAKRLERKLKQEKEQKRIAKLQKKHRKKNRKKKGKNSDANLRHIAEVVRVSNTPRISNFNYATLRYELNKEEYDRNQENKLKSQLDNDLCLFVMNQISLMMQFYVDYESERVNVGEQILAKENDINQCLEKHSILLGNPLDAGIKRWLQFRPIHGPEKFNPRPLQTETMYVVFESIDILRPDDANYDSISPICKVDMETDYYNTTPTKEEYMDILRENKWRGYVRLKVRECASSTQSYNAGSSANDAEIYTECSSGYSTGSYASKTSKTNITAKCNTHKLQKEDEYAYVTSLNNHRPLAELRMTNPVEQQQLNERVLPESCVSSLGQFVEPDEDTDEEEHTETETESETDSETEYGTHKCTRQSRQATGKEYHTIRAINQYKQEMERRRELLQQKYLNSKQFMCYFGELVRQKLAKQLQIDADDLKTSTYVGASIHTRHYQIIPAIHVACNAQNWPHCAFQFKRRERPINTNPLTGEQSQWPTRSMINRIESFGFHVIPLGFAPKRNRNPFRQLEWRIVFPKAERYLERNLSSTQMKVFMMCKALVRTFVEPQEKDNALQFTNSYLRTHLFWECERNYTAWSEEFLGEVLLRFLSSFMERLREKTLMDFFIGQRNLFESIPDFSLLRLNQILSDIVANPLMHLMVAFRNLSLTEDFFPKLNYRRLFDNLVENDMLKLKMLMKNARTLPVANAADDDEPLMMQDVGAQGLLGMKEHREKSKGKLRRRTHMMRHNIEKQKQLEIVNNRLSVDSINVEFFFDKNLGAAAAQQKRINQGVENLRRTNILEIILDHLVLTAERAIQMRSVHLAQLLLDQAKRLCKFYHNYGCDMGAQEYQKTIAYNEGAIGILRKNDSNIPPPALPVRTSVEPVKSISHKVKELRQSQEQSIAISYHQDKIVTFPSRESIPEVKQRALVIETSTQVTEKRRPTVGNGVQFSPPEPRKSIKFTKHVVEVHDGDSNPIQKPEGYSPVSILRQFGANKERKKSAKFCDEIECETSEDEEEIVEKISQKLKQDNTKLSTMEEQSTIRSMSDDYRTIELTDEGGALSGTEDAHYIESSAAALSAKNVTININTPEPTTDVTSSTDTTTDKSSSYLMNKFGTAAGILKNSAFVKSKPITQLHASTEKLINSMTLEDKCQKMTQIVKRNTILIKGAFNQSSDS